MRTRPRLRLRITAAAQAIVRRGHPWLFAESIHEQNRSGKAGELAVIYDRNDQFLAIGLYDPASPLRVRILHRGKPITIDDAWFRRQLEAAVERRASLFDAQTTGFRWVYGESDGWPGLVLDRYAETLVLKLYTAAWLPHLATVTRTIREVLKPDRLVLRLSRNIQAYAAETFHLNDGDLVCGEPLPADGRVLFRENGLRFEADVVKGQKTGFFLDQRENRRRVEQRAQGADVLNAFSFSGGFSLYAARGGARSVTDLDISAHALESGARHFGLNKCEPAVAACRREAIQADVFEWLAAHPSRRFDVLVLDPPSLARREAERAGAIQAYSKLAAGGISLLRTNGILVAASCSAHVSKEEFFAAVQAECRRSGRQFTILEAVGHPPDHPVGFSEAEYLKCIYLEVR